MAPHKYSSLLQIFSKPLFSSGFLSSTFELTLVPLLALFPLPEILCPSSFVYRSLKLCQDVTLLCLPLALVARQLCYLPASRGAPTSPPPAGPGALPGACLFPWSFLPTPQAAHPGVFILLKHPNSSLYSSLSSGNFTINLTENNGC